MNLPISNSLRARCMIATSAGALIASLALGSAAAAQTRAVDARWQAFLGCWIPDESSAAIGANAVSGSMVCVVPVQNSASVDIATINNRVVVNRDRITANGERSVKNADDCPGWESATWSADGHRIFTRSEFACSANLTVKGSGVFAISSAGDWVQVQGNTVGLNAGARVLRLRPSDVALTPGSIIADGSTVTTVPVQSRFAQQAIRTAAGGPTDAGALLDIAQNVDEQVAQAWLSEFGVSTKVNAQQLVALSKAGMSSNLTDMMVAMANPTRFQLKTRSPQAATQISAAERAMNDRCNFDNMLNQGFDISGFPISSFDRRNCLSRYGSAFGFLNGWQYGWGNQFNQFGYNGFNGGNYYYGSQPIIIVTRDPDGDVPLGRAVKGGGYTRGTSSSSGSTTPRETTSSGGSSSSSGGSSSGGSSSGGSSSGGSTSTGGARTAKPRPPGGI